MKIFIVDDEPSVISNLKYSLSKISCEIESAVTYKDAITVLLSKKFDVIICDHYFPAEKNNCQGLDLVRTIRKHKITTPVLVLTGCDADQITPWGALDVGVDDFVRKPYNPQELVARIKALFRRNNDKTENENIIADNGVEIHLNSKKVFTGKREVYLSNTLFVILKKLLQAPGRFVSYEEFIKDIWGESALYDGGTSNILRAHMSYLRKALGAPYMSYIRTIHGRGFIWECSEENK